MKITKTQKEILKYNYEQACQDYVDIFLKKHGYNGYYWVGGEVGDKVCIIEQYFFDMQDIIFDVQKNLPIGLIFEWQDKCVENGGMLEIGNLKNFYKNYKLNLKKK